MLEGIFVQQASRLELGGILLILYKGKVFRTTSTRFLWLACLLFVLPAFARANIGDNVTKLRQLYGSAKEVGGQLLFQHGGYSICVYFDGDASAMEVFVRDGSVPDKTAIDQADIDSILALEGEGEPWTPIQSRTGKPTWLRADHKLIARFNPGENILAIMVNAK